MVLTNIPIGTEFVECLGRIGTQQWRVVWRVVQIRTFAWVKVQKILRYEKDLGESSYRTVHVPQEDGHLWIKNGQVSKDQSLVRIRLGDSRPAVAYRIRNPTADPFSELYYTSV
jgi:hypothetical protein